ncbi:polysaccharide deacetylase family protein [Capillimicrobium parvum]|uniref:NodB homology domain-containing protein n=1 Tax=Capillimicrobium parvum TaxID=2884022 RepID=A0A9E6XYD9_9ACTN|nr:polysaccharide deacetylase family protein [Capillimicrobium parvum]UGS36172.1 hypothetical protein DSM104329_02572 [Capillimicrobium parvum]
MHGRYLGALWALAAALAAALLLAAPAGATVVSLTFDDAFADQMPAASMLGAAGLPATFFVMSSAVGQTGHLTAADLAALKAAGHEIGGHTLDHADLPTLGPDDQRHEICDDRQALLALGTQAAVFAYPYGHFDASAQAIARSCGYTAARESGGLAAPGGCWGPCPAAETLPPADPFAIRSAASIKSTVGLADLQQLVLSAEATGGWLTLTFHHVCTDCGTYATDPSVLAAFAAWLAPRRASGTAVLTMSQALLQPAAPVAPAAEPPAAPVPAPAAPVGRRPRRRCPAAVTSHRHRRSHHVPARCRAGARGVRARRWPATTYLTSTARSAAARH